MDMLVTSVNVGSQLIYVDGSPSVRLCQHAGSWGKQVVRGVPVQLLYTLPTNNVTN